MKISYSPQRHISLIKLLPLGEKDERLEMEEVWMRRHHDKSKVKGDREDDRERGIRTGK